MRNQVETQKESSIWLQFTKPICIIFLESGGGGGGGGGWEQ